MRVEGEVSERRGLIWPIGALVLSGVLLTFLAFQTAVSAATFVAIALLVTLLSFFALTRGASSPRARGRSRGRAGERAGKRRVGADARGLSIDGELVLPRRAILRARVRDELDGTAVVVVEPRGFIAPARLVHVHSARIAQALADTLEQDPVDVVQFDALPPWAHRMRWLAIALTTSPWILFNLLRHMPAFTLLIVLALYGLIALPMIVPQKIAIGEDGIFLRWAGQRRFVSFGALIGVRSTPLGVELDLADDRTIEIRLTHRAEAETQRRNAMLARIEQGIQAHRALAPAEDEALLLRGSRDFGEWIDEMTRLGAGDAGGYRVMAIPRERLWAVLENPGADPSARQGAALALHVRLEDQERERLDSIAQKSASPRLRVALDAVANHALDLPKLRVAFEAVKDRDLGEEDDRTNGDTSVLAGGATSRRRETG